MLDIEGSDVVRQQHDLVGEKLLAVHARQILFGHPIDEVDDKVAGAGAGVDDVDAT